MAAEILHVHNQPGVSFVRVRTKEFMCIGALPPLDHPHVYLNMGEESRINCPYCATRFEYDPSLEHKVEPSICLYEVG